MSRKPALVAALLALLCFAPSLVAGFVYDDRLLIEDNPYAHGIEHVDRAFTTAFWDTGHPPQGGARKLAGGAGAAGGLVYYRPLVAASYALNWALGGGQPFAFHLVNVLAHALAVYLAARIAARWTGPCVAGAAHSGGLPGDARLGALVAVVFALHPTRSESVAWVSGRTDVFMTLFALAAVALAGRATEARGAERTVCIGASLFLFGASLLCKEPALFLFALFWVDAIVSRNGGAARVAAWGATALALVYLFARLAYPIAPAPASLTPLSGFFTLGAYVERVVWPWPQTFFHRPLTDAGPLADAPALVALGVAAAALALFALIRWARSHRAEALLFATAAALLVPVLNFVPTGLRTTTADRFLYLPLFLLLVAVARRTAPILLSFSAKRAARVAFVGLCTVWGFINIVRTLDYQNAESFWTHELALRPDNPEALRWLAKLRAEEGDLDEARRLYTELLSAASRRYRDLNAPIDRARALSSLFSLAAGQTPDGDVVALRELLRAFSAILDAAPARLPARAAGVEVRGAVSPASLTALRNAEKPALAAEAAFIAARLGRVREAARLLDAVRPEDTAHVPNPPNLVLTHARLLDFDGAAKRLEDLRRSGVESEIFDGLALRVAKARALDEQARAHSGVDQAARQALAFAELGAYLRALRVLRPVVATKEPHVAELYVQLLLLSRLEKEALSHAQAVFGAVEGERRFSAMRAEMPPGARQLRPAPEPSAWWAAEE